MKKTLIALAALAASGASFAQTTLTGTLAMGYKATTSVATNAAVLGTGQAAAPATDAAGFGVDTSEIVISVKEDIGGGQSVQAKMTLAGLDRSGESGNGTVQGRDATLTYTNTSFGQIQLGTTMGGALHSGIPSAGAPVIDMDGKIFELRGSNDFISYSVPIGPVFFQYKRSESGKGLGLGMGDAGVAGTKVGQHTSDFTLAYLAGPLELVGAYRSYDNRNSTAIYTTESLTKDDGFAIQAGYDAGFARFGFGASTVKASVGPRVLDMLLGVSVPYGKWTFGMTLGRETVSGIAETPASVFHPTLGAFVKPVMQKADGTAHSISYGVKYDLSKRTNITAKYASWTRSGYEQFEAYGATGNDGVFGYQPAASEAVILLSHSF
jgi:predicted porin